MRAAVTSPFAISSAPIFIFAAISDASSADAGGREADDGEMGRADCMGRRAASTEVASLAAPRASMGPGLVAAAGRDGGSEFGALRFPAGRGGAGRALVWLEAGANWGDLDGPDGCPESGFEALRFAAAVEGAGRTLACSEAGATSGGLVDSLKPKKYPVTPATAAAINTPPVSRTTAAAVGTVERGSASSGTRSDPSASRERSSTTATSPSKTPRRALRFHGGSGASVSDSGFSDSGFSDSGFSDSGFSDSGFSDSGFSDSGFSDSGFSDSGFSD